MEKKLRTNELETTRIKEDRNLVTADKRHLEKTFQQLRVEFQLLRSEKEACDCEMEKTVRDLQIQVEHFKMLEDKKSEIVKDRNLIEIERK